MFNFANEQKKIQLMWIFIAWFFLFRPVSIPVAALIPIFYLPLSAAAVSSLACSFYMSDDIMLFLLAGVLILLLNNSGADRRIALKIMTSGDASTFGATKMIFKCGTAAFVTSMFSSRLIATSMITEYYTKAMANVEYKYGRSKDEPKLSEVRYLVNNAIQTSSSIGSVAIIHSSFSTLCFRAIFYAGAGEKAEFPDIFNYLQYSAFAFPTALIMFIVNIIYYIVIVGKVAGKPMSSYTMNMVQKALLDNQNQLPRRPTIHEILSLVGVLLSHAAYFSRHSHLGGWASMFFSKHELSTDQHFLPNVRDATVAAGFVILLHAVPISVEFIKYFTAKKRSELPKPKPASPILWWKFVDKNLNYAYFFLLGSGIAILNMALQTKLCETISEHSGCEITKHSWDISLLIVVVIAALLSNVVSSTAACVIFQPFVMCAAIKGTLPWPSKAFMGALAVGIATNFGFMYPFLYTPAYFTVHVGKVPLKKMAMLAAGSVVVCILVLWLSLAHFAPILWDAADGYPPLSGEETPPPDE
ncbi:uncharacterized protein LOC142974886 [Anticarsia gemmatalis]|uniref:uncharacterized protein LOC142974886 n=1 Tax=Anticarsia gemmatalis TaxID=129554 RepID=UPI003F774980